MLHLVLVASNKAHVKNKMKIAELNIGLSSKLRKRPHYPETVLHELRSHGFLVITYRLQEAESNDGKETCLACKVELPDGWQILLEHISDVLGQDCIVVAGFIGRAPYDTFAPELWVSPEAPKSKSSPLKLSI